ncbi:MAG: tyrosine-type recombinase/integrase [Thermomicrobiales bacterium]
MARGRIYRRSKTYTIVYERPRDPVTGARRQQTKGGFRTRKEAEQALTAAQRQIDTGTDLEPTTLTVAAYLEHWLETFARRRLRQASYEKYRYSIRRYLVPLLGTVLLTRLTPAHVSQLHSALADAGLSANSIEGVHVILHGALKQAVRWQLLAHNVCDAVPPPTFERKVFPIWDAATAARFRDAALDEPGAAIYVLAILTGMRRGELLALRWADVDLRQRQVTVSRARVRVEGGAKIEGTKGKRARILRLTPGQAAWLRQHRQRQLADRLAAGDAWEDHDLVFPAAPGRGKPGGRPLAPNSFWKYWRRLLARLELPAIRPHDLRHTNATLLLEAGISARVVQERLGHASTAITQDVYSHVTERLQDEAAAALDAALGQALVDDGDADSGAV